MESSLRERDLRRLWHPCSQMRDYEDFPLLEIAAAEGPYLIERNGRRVIDAISSWWCKTLGHTHPALMAALRKQSERFEHVIGANTVQAPAVELAERLAQLCEGLDRVFFAGDGSMAVEIAMKMALHAQRRLGRRDRIAFAALQNGYHGESAGALGVSALGLYRQPYAALLPRGHFVAGIPYRSGSEDGNWQDAGKEWPSIEAQLEPLAGILAAVLVEPVLQGAGGMLCYSPDLLRRLRSWTSAKGVFLICDEILTGFGRSGEMLGVHHAGIIPDFICLSKGLTGGVMPLSATLAGDAVYELFFGEFGAETSFLHSNTYWGNALGCAVALAAQREYQKPDWLPGVRRMGEVLREKFREVARSTGRLENIRGVGGVAAGDLVLDRRHRDRRMGHRVFSEAVKAGALVRPLGNTLYWLPPLNVGELVLEDLARITATAIGRAFGD